MKWLNPILSSIIFGSVFVLSFVLFNPAIVNAGMFSEYEKETENKLTVLVDFLEKAKESFLNNQADQVETTLSSVRAETSEPDFDISAHSAKTESVESDIDIIDENNDGAETKSFLSFALGSVKELFFDKPKDATASVFSQIKDFVFPGKNSDTSNGDLLVFDRDELEQDMADKQEQMKEQFDSAIEEAQILKTRMADLESELSKLKQAGLTVSSGANNSQTQVIDRTIERAVSGVSENVLNSKISSLKTELQNINENLINKINVLSAQTSSQTSAVYQTISLTNKIDSLSNVRISNATVSGMTGLTDADIPDTITASNYLSLSGGTMTGNILMPASSYLSFGSEAGSSGYGFRDNSGTMQFKNSSGSWTTFSPSQWEVSGSNTYYSSGNVGIGTSSPYAKLSVVGETVSSYFTATSTTATSTFPYLRVLTNSNLGTVVGGTWQGSAVGSAYGGTGQNLSASSGLLNFYSGAASTIATSSLGLLTTNVAEGSNLYWTDARFDTRLSATTTLPNLTTLLGLTNATTTGITSTNSWLGTIRSGTWNGTAIGSQYGGTGLDSSALTGIAQIVGGTWSASSTLSTAYGGTGWNNLQANTVLLGNGAGRIATTTAGTDGQVLALVSGVPTWQSTTTLSTITGTLAVNKGGTGQTSFGQGWLHSDGTTLTSSTSPTVNYIVATSTTATSTFAWGVAANALNITSQTATSTFANGINLTSNGCFSINGTCVGGGLSALTGTPLTKGYFLVGNDAGSSQATSTLFISSTGSLGIGTTTPNSVLNIAGVTPKLTITDTSAGTNLKHWFMQSTGGQFRIATTSDALADASVPAFTIDSNGYIGVGTSTPASGSKFNVLDVANPQLRLAQSGSDYTTMSVAAATGDLSLNLYGTNANDISLYMPNGSTGANLWVCEGATCPSVTLSDGGNIVVGGDIKYPTSGRIKRSVILTAAGGIVPTSGGATKSQVDTATSSYYVLDFGNSATTSAFWQWTIPDSYDGGNITAMYYWFSGTAGGGAGVSWCPQYNGVNTSENINADLSSSPCDTTTGNVPTTANRLATTTQTLSSSLFTPGEVVTFKLSRGVDMSSDDFAATARLYMIKIEYGVATESD